MLLVGLDSATKPERVGFAFGRLRMAVDHCGDSESREALGGAEHVDRFAFRLADPHVLVRGWTTLSVEKPMPL